MVKIKDFTLRVLYWNFFLIVKANQAWKVRVRGKEASGDMKNRNKIQQLRIQKSTKEQIIQSTTSQNMRIYVTQLNTV